MMSTASCCCRSRPAPVTKLPFTGLRMTYRPAHRQVKLAASWSELIHTQRATKDLRAELKDALTQVLSDQSDFFPEQLYPLSDTRLEVIEQHLLAGLEERLRSSLGVQTVLGSFLESVRQQGNVSVNEQQPLAFWASPAGSPLTWMARLMELLRCVRPDKRLPLLKHYHVPQESFLKEVAEQLEKVCEAQLSGKVLSRASYHFLHLEGASGTGKTAALRHMQPELQDYVAAHQDFYPKAAQVLSGPVITCELSLYGGDSSDHITRADRDCSVGHVAAVRILARALFGRSVGRLRNDLAQCGASSLLKGLDLPDTLQMLSYQLCTDPKSLPTLLQPRHPVNIALSSASSNYSPAAVPGAVKAALLLSFDGVRRLEDQFESAEGISQRQAHRRAKDLQIVLSELSAGEHEAVAPSLDAGLVVHTVFAGTGLESLRDDTGPNNLPVRCVYLEPLTEQQALAALKMRCREAPPAWQFTPEILDLLLETDEMRELMAMLGGVPRACVEHMARFMCHPHWARQVVATLADGDASPNQLRDHVNVLQNKVAETMHRHATIGPVSVQRCLGGEKGLFAAYLLSKTGIPCSTCTQLGTHRGAVTVAHAASSGLFSLRRLSSSILSVQVQVQLLPFIEEVCLGYIRRVAHYDSLHLAWSAAPMEGKMVVSEFEVMVAQRLLQGSIVGQKVFPYHLRTSLRQLFPGALASNEERMETEYHRREFVVRHLVEPMTLAPANFNSSTAVKVCMLSPDKDGLLPLKRNSWQGIEASVHLLDPELILILNGSTSPNAVFDLCFCLEPTWQQKRLLVFLDLKCREGDPKNGQTRQQKRIVSHIRSQQVQAAMTATSTWGKGVDGGCNVAFGFVHPGNPGSEGGLEATLAGQREHFIFALTGEGLKKFMPIFAKQPHLLSALSSRFDSVDEDNG